MNKKIGKHIMRYILVILIIINCTTIFKFSSDQGTKSAGKSRSVGRTIVMLDSRNKNLSEEEINIKVEDMQHLLRKTAHFSIYMLLGFLLMSCSCTFNGRKLIKFDIGILLAYLYACTDEFHQSFVPGRSAEYRDVCIDTLGALIGVIIALLLVILIKQIQKRKQEKYNEKIKENPECAKKKNVLFIASTGGHLNELMQTKTLFKKYNYQIITEKNEVDDSLKDEYKDKIHFLIYGTKKYPFKYIFKFTANCFISLYYYFRYQPDVIVTTGTHTAVPMCYIAKIFGGKVIFIETFANRTTGTVAGRIVYPIADTFVVQWDEMLKVYPKAVCWGWIY